MAVADLIIYAGFPAPSDNYREKEIDWNEVLKPRPSSTFYGRVKGRCMMDSCIPPDSIVVIDRSVEPTHNRIFVAVIEGHLYLKRLVFQKGHKMLVADRGHKPILIKNDSDLVVWGTVTKIIIDPIECGL